MIDYATGNLIQKIISLFQIFPHKLKPWKNNYPSIAIREHKRRERKRFFENRREI